MHTYTKGLITLYKKHADKAAAAGAKAYMRNQFEFFGMKTVQRRNLFTEYTKKNLPSFTDVPLIIEELWTLPQRELQYSAMELLFMYKKQWIKETIQLIEFIIVNKSWWDTVDYAACDLAGQYFRLFPGAINKITGRWNRSNNIWLQRSSILFQKKYKKETDTALLAKYILAQTSSKEFFIQKVIGWALREYAYVDPKWVSQFVKQNKLAPLSEREALKRIK